MYTIIWDEKSLDQLHKLESNISKRIAKKVDELSNDPFSRDIKKLKGMHDFRLRVGDYRVIFEIDGKTIYILKVGHRRHIYDR